MRTVDITGVGMTHFGKHPDASLRGLGTSAIEEALSDADLKASDVDLVVHANAFAGLLTGQESVRGQVVTADTPLAGLPLLNVENACASSSSGVHLGLMAIRSGMYDTVLVVGVEQMTKRGSRVALDAIATAADIDRIAGYNRQMTDRDGPAESFFMEVYAAMCADYMGRSGATVRDFAEVAAKNSGHGSLNPKAQYRTRRTADEVLASRVVAGPLTTLMCSPLGDGAAAVVLQTAETVRNSPGAVRVLASALRSGIPGGGADPLEQRTIDAAYAEAGVGRTTSTSSNCTMPRHRRS